MSLPHLRAGFGSVSDGNNVEEAHSITVLFCAFAEICRSAYQTAAVFADHCARAASLKVLQDKNDEKRARSAEVRIEDLIWALQREVSTANGMAQQIKPLIFFLEQHGRLPTAEDEVVSVETIQRLLQHYNTTLLHVQNREMLNNYHLLLCEVLVSGKTIDEVVKDVEEEEEEEEKEEEDEEKEEEDGEGVCHCDVCVSMIQAREQWNDWSPQDRFDERMKQATEQLSEGLERVGNMLAGDEEEEEEEEEENMEE